MRMLAQGVGAQYCSRVALDKNLNEQKRSDMAA